VDQAISLNVTVSNADFTLYSNVSVVTAQTQIDALDAAQLIISNGIADDEEVSLALTFAVDHIAVSINGGVVSRLEHPTLDPSLSLIEMLFQSGTGDGRFRSFAFYEAVADADLPTLSAL
jgi:hypothetical protein